MVDKDKSKDKRHRQIVDDLGMKPKESIEILATSIKKISEGVQELLAGGLTEECLVVLIQRKTNVNITDITRVLRALPRLKAWYLK